MAEEPENMNSDSRLSDIVRKARMSSADRQDVVVDMKEADRVRIELLAERLLPIIDDVDKEDDRFDFTISTGVQPRFWIDSVAHVHMGRDRRTYRFVRDTRLGRVIVGETGDIGEMADIVTRYIADRIVEREKILEGDLENFRDYYARTTSDRLGAKKTKVAQNDDELIAEKREMPASAPLIIGLTWFVLGSVLGLAIAFNYYEQIYAFLQSI